MAASLVVTSGNGTIGDIQDWELSEDATPTVMGQGSGDVGSGSITGTPGTRSRMLNGNGVTFSDPEQGSLAMIVDSVAINSQAVLQVVGPLGPLNINVVAPPVYNMTLAQAIQLYINLAYTSASAPSFSYLPTSNPSVVFNGWAGNLWDNLNDLLCLYGLEIANIAGVITVRTVALSVLDITFKDDQGTTFSDGSDSLALYVQCNYYNGAAIIPGGTVYNWSQNPSYEVSAANNTVTVPAGEGTSTSSGRILASTIAGGIVAPNGSYVYHQKVAGALHTGSINTCGYGVIFTHTFAVTSVAKKYFTVQMNAYAQFINEAVATLPGPGVSFGVTPSVSWYDSGSNLIRTDTFSQVNIPGENYDSHGNGLPVTTYTPITFNGTPPSNAASAIVTLSGFTKYFLGSGSITAGTLDVSIDAWMISDTNYAYIDGNTAGGGSWSGTSGLSSSSFVIPNTKPLYNAYADNNNILSVSSGQSVSGILNIQGTADSVVQPAYQALAPATYTALTPGCYYVSGADDLPVPQAEWLAGGGSLVISVGANPGELDYVFTGPPVDFADVAGPYSVSVSDGSNQYATLSIIGSGVLITQQSVTVDTGAPTALTQNTQPTVIDSPFINTAAQAWDMAQQLARRLSGACPSITFNIPHSAANGFGYNAGCLVVEGNNIWRITSAPSTAVGISCTAEMRVLDSDITAQWAAQSAGAFEAWWETQVDATTGQTLVFEDSDLTVRPLWS